MWKSRQEIIRLSLQDIGGGVPRNCVYDIAEIFLVLNKQMVTQLAQGIQFSNLLRQVVLRRPNQLSHQRTAKSWHVGNSDVTHAMRSKLRFLHWKKSIKANNKNHLNISNEDICIPAYHFFVLVKPLFFRYVHVSVHKITSLKQLYIQMEPHITDRVMFKLYHKVVIKQ